jgi:hypothetical protein
MKEEFVLSKENLPPSPRTCWVVVRQGLLKWGLQRMMNKTFLPDDTKVESFVTAEAWSKVW